MRGGRGEFSKLRGKKMTEIDKLNIGGKRERIVVGPKNEVKESWGKKKKKKRRGAGE